MSRTWVAEQTAAEAERERLRLLEEEENVLVGPAAPSDLAGKAPNSYGGALLPGMQRRRSPSARRRDGAWLLLRMLVSQHQGCVGNSMHDSRCF